jgi:hypothetical protein
MTRDFDLVPALPLPAAAAPCTADDISAALSSIDAAVSALRALAPLPPASLTPVDRLAADPTVQS